MRISDWISDAFSSDLLERRVRQDDDIEILAKLPGVELPRIDDRERKFMLVEDPAHPSGRHQPAVDVDERDPRTLHRGAVADRRRCRAFDIEPEFAGRSLDDRSEEHTSELQSLMRISYAVFCLKKQKKNNK